MEVFISRLNHTGDGIGDIDGKVVFIPKTIPGDVVEIFNLRDFKTYYRADVLRYVVSSSDRVNIKCPYFDKCGGCQLMGLSYIKQLEYKRGKVENILKRYADIEIDLDIVLSDKIYGYRNKITLQVVDGRVGLYEFNSNRLIEVSNCLLVDDSTNNLIKVISNLKLDKVKNIMIRSYEDSLMVQFIGNIDKKYVINKLENIVDIIYINDVLVYGDKNLLVKLGDYKYKISPYSFFQVNYSQAELLYDKVKEYLGNGNNRVLDLYCGTGSIGIYVSSCCKEVIGIEINESSIRDAIENIKLNNINNVKVIQGDVAKVLESNEEYDAIIVDPPRSGLDKITKKTLSLIKSKKIIYVSCDPITLSRDLNYFKELYDINNIMLVDMFPNTYHVESVVLMSLKK